MAHRQAAWCYALSRSLRGQSPTSDLGSLLAETEIRSYQGSHNVPNDILHRQAEQLRHLYDEGRLELYQFVELERTLVRLTNSMGGCERIKNTPFPTSYSRMVHGMIYVFVFFLPFGLVDVPPLGLVATSVALSYGFLLIERVALYLQDPFSNQPSDTPMLALSRTIEINIRQMLGETELPEKMEPVGGVLY
jgi:putative membrane protein